MEILDDLFRSTGHRAKSVSKELLSLWMQMSNCTITLVQISIFKLTWAVGLEKFDKPDFVQ